MNIKKVMDVPVLEWEHSKVIYFNEKFNCTEFKGVKFLIDELEQFNGIKDVTVRLDTFGFIVITDGSNNQLFENHLSKIHSFKALLIK